MVNPIDEYAVQRLGIVRWEEVEIGRRRDSDLDDENEKKKLEEHKAECEPSTKRTKEGLGGKVERIVVSSRLADSPRVQNQSRA